MFVKCADLMALCMIGFSTTQKISEMVDCYVVLLAYIDIHQMELNMTGSYVGLMSVMKSVMMIS